MRVRRRYLAAVVGVVVLVPAAPALGIDIDSGTTGVTGITVDGDLAMQVLWEQVGQFSPPSVRPANAGFALEVDGTVYGSASVFPGATPFVRGSEEQVGPYQLSAQADAGGLVAITAMAIFTPGEDHVGIAYTLDHAFTEPTPFNAYVAAHLFPQGSGLGIGFFDDATHRVGSIGETGDFGVQIGALTPSNAHHYQGVANDVRTAVEQGGDLPDQVCRGSTAPPYTDDPCLLDSGVALQWTGTLEPGVPLTIQAYWVLGAAAAPPQVPFEIHVDDIDALLAGFELSSDFSRGNTSAVELGVQVTDAGTGETTFVYSNQPATGANIVARVLVPAALGKTLIVQPIAKILHADGTVAVVAAGAPTITTVTSQTPPPTTMTAIAAYVLENAGQPVPPGTTVCGFNDVLGNFAELAICWARDGGITAGVAADLYAPQFPVSRNQMAVFLQRLLALPDGSPAEAGVTFSDVPATSFAYGAIYAIAQAGITSGVAPGLYAPDADVTREQMAVFLVGTYTTLRGSAPPGSNSAARFTDVSPTSFAYTAIGQLYDLGITSGLDADATLYGPGDDVLRDQIAQFLHNADLAAVTV